MRRLSWSKGATVGKKPEELRIVQAIGSNYFGVGFVVEEGHEVYIEVCVLLCLNICNAVPLFHS